MKITSEKNLGTGLMMVVIAGAFAWKSFDYRLGTAAAMGPGYFPLILSTLLGIVGLAVLAKGFLKEGEEMETIPWKALLVIVGSVVLFGLALPRLGLFVSLALLLFGSAAASRRFKLNLRATAGVLLLIAFCYSVFILGLGIPLPLRGSWL